MDAFTAVFSPFVATAVESTDSPVENRKKQQTSGLTFTGCVVA